MDTSKRGNRLVQADKLRVAYERRRKGQTLPLPAAELVGVEGGLLFPKTYLLQQVVYAVIRFDLVNLLVDKQGFGNDIAKRMRGLSELHGSWKTADTSVWYCLSSSPSRL